MDHPVTQPANHSELLQHCSGVLDEARQVLVERGQNYADIADNSRVYCTILRQFGITAPPDITDTMWHCLSNIATKMARMATGNRLHEDTMVDAANYWTLMLADIRRNKVYGTPETPLEKSPENPPPRPWYEMLGKVIPVRVSRGESDAQILADLRPLLKPSEPSEPFIAYVKAQIEAARRFRA